MKIRAEGAPDLPLPRGWSLPTLDSVIMQVIEKSTSEIGLHLDETPAYRHLDLCVEQKSIAYLTCAYTYGVKCVPGPARGERAGERGGAWFGDVSFSSTAGGVSPCALAYRMTAPDSPVEALRRVSMTKY